jgi:hypothetical protein
MGHSSERVASERVASERRAGVCPRLKGTVALTTALGLRPTRALATAGPIVVQSRRAPTEARAPVFSTALAQVELHVDQLLAEYPALDGQA